VPRSAAVSWVALYTAMLLDMAQVFALDYSDGFTHPAFAALAIAAFTVEVGLFSVALRRINSAVAYGLYGLGTAGVAVISIGWLGEPLTTTKAIALVAVIAGAVLLNLDGTKPPAVSHTDDRAQPAPVTVGVLPVDQQV
jgi:quaternary ammonium compound-resistance protein SugE